MKDKARAAWIPAVLAAGWLGSFGAVAEEVDFKKDVMPILAEHCLGCHGPDKVKGRYRLDTKEAAFKGGSSGEKAIVAGKPDESELIKRVILPAGDDDLMPPEGGPLPDDQIALLKKWVESGAKWPEGEVVKAAAKGAAAAGEAPAATPVRPSRPVPPLPELPKTFDVTEKEGVAIAALSKKGVDVRPIAQNVPWKEVNLRLKGQEVTDETVGWLSSIPSLVEVRLGNTRVSDAGLRALAGLPHLQVLSLELTGVTDAGLEWVGKIPNLVYLNLYGTQVTDAGLKSLSGLKHLRNLYVWQTGVTPEGVAGLSALLPGCDINLGVELTVASPSE